MAFTPSQIAQTLEIPPSTLRRWSTRFVELMSFSHSPGQKRSYTLEDLATLRRVRDLSRSGYTLDQIQDQLLMEAVGAVGAEAPTTALINLSDIAQVMDNFRAQFASVEQRNNELQERVNALEEYIHTPWWRRKKPPKSASD